MPKKGKGRYVKPHVITPVNAAKFKTIIEYGGRGAGKTAKVNLLPVPDHFILNPNAVNQLWNWQTLENVNF